MSTAKINTYSALKRKKSFDLPTPLRNKENQIKYTEKSYESPSKFLNFDTSQLKDITNNSLDSFQIFQIPLFDDETTGILKEINMIEEIGLTPERNCKRRDFESVTDKMKIEEKIEKPQNSETNKINYISNYNKKNPESLAEIKISDKNLQSDKKVNSTAHTRRNSESIQENKTNPKDLNENKKIENFTEKKMIKKNIENNRKDVNSSDTNKISKTPENKRKFGSVQETKSVVKESQKNNDLEAKIDQLKEIKGKLDIEVNSLKTQKNKLETKTKEILGLKKQALDDISILEEIKLENEGEFSNVQCKINERITEIERLSNNVKKAYKVKCDFIQNRKEKQENERKLYFKLKEEKKEKELLLSNLQNDFFELEKNINNVRETKEEGIQIIYENLNEMTEELINHQEFKKIKEKNMKKEIRELQEELEKMKQEVFDQKNEQLNFFQKINDLKIDVKKMANEDKILKEKENYLKLKEEDLSNLEKRNFEIYEEFIDVTSRNEKLSELVEKREQLKCLSVVNQSLKNEIEKYRNLRTKYKSIILKKQEDSYQNNKKSRNSITNGNFQSRKNSLNCNKIIGKEEEVKNMILKQREMNEKQKEMMENLIEEIKKLKEKLEDEKDLMICFEMGLEKTNFD